MLSYGATLVLLGAGDDRRAEDRPWLALLTAATAVADAVNGMYLFGEQVTGRRRICSWCTLAAAANVAVVPLVLPEGAASLAGRAHLRHSTAAVEHGARHA